VGYADLKNDVVFRKVFGQHPRVLVGLLNDLLEREGDRAIVHVDYLPSEQAPLLPGLKLSILDVRCRERGGAVFVVEMQVLPVTGFLNRVVFNACKAYVGTLERGKRYDTLTDVVAVSICDFTLWPDAERDAAALPAVPLVSRWSMTERLSGARGLGQVQYVFMELPKLGDHVPGTANERWAALFASAPELAPESMASVPLTDAQREALELAREETFTAQERDAIERSTEEVDQVRRTVLAEAAQAQERGHREGRREGNLSARRSVLLMLLEAAEIEVSPSDRAQIEGCDELATLDTWIRRARTATSREDVFTG
jgi:predicted transposase/invertase (TIGR01784 family)